MTLLELCEIIQLDQEIVKNVLEINTIYNHNDLKFMWEKLYSSTTWDEGIKQLQEYFGEDKNGMKILTCILNCTLYTYELYEQKGISIDIFVDTVKFIPRFFERHMQTYGFYAFIWAWWFPRQLSLHEFRIGELEYEMKYEGNVPQIHIHIPSDAIIKKDNLCASYCGLKKFLNNYFPEYINAELYCDSWLLAPALKELLPSDSNILYFQNSFEVISVDEQSNAFLDWIYLRNDIPYDKLPESTYLQRKVKIYLLEGGKIGWAFGKLKGFF
ncbi:acyltransferase domain-containing protein [Clostridium cellulovorans]|uniref:DUF5596 domain-containing protein n=1 Tax=Clostridium cellulovorans (strain ATCC 35296 / DSM 3052 / OCM 3 / 743B) TaxID=573061 RepID=D9SW47_CLOC7|nr:acyltransferase domain-containing protein [Clostridium cellulovorans]ADL51191.1 hypothetical protein Clocel_1438 [Clostridium cellulovorans 743B]